MVTRSIPTRTSCSISIAITPPVLLRNPNCSFSKRAEDVRQKHRSIGRKWVAIFCRSAGFGAGGLWSSRWTGGWTIGYRGNRRPTGSTQNCSSAQHAHSERHGTWLVTSCSEIHFLEFPLKGYVAWRNIDDGSWLIKDFCRIVRSKAHEDHLIDIITEVRVHTSSIFALCIFFSFSI